VRERVELPDPSDVDLARLAQVTCIHTDDLGARRDRAPEGSCLVRFDQRRHPKRLGDRDHVTQEIVIERLGDQQDRVRTRGARFVDLIGIDDHVFREQWHLHGLADRDEIGESSAPMSAFGKHGDRGRAGCDVTDRLRDGIEVIREDARRRRDSLDLRDDRKA